ncbi:MAG: hypothetical protein IJ328_03305, partial [Muribaculaceae bacterium]|nr:hypothetical protein [Muribaculaceae bacterium]
AMDVKSETVYNNIPVANVPMQRNYRTNIVGNLLTSGAVFNVVINPIYVDDLPNTEAERLAMAAQVGGTVMLTEDLVLKETLVIKEDVTVEINLNGHTISGAIPKAEGSIIKNNGTLKLVDGTVSSTAANGGSAIVNYGTVIAENVTLNGSSVKEGTSWPSYPVNNYGDMELKNTTINGWQGGVSCNAAGTTTLENCNITKNYLNTSSHTFYIVHKDANVIVDGGTYTNDGMDGSLAYVSAGTFTVNDGTFTATNGGYGFAALTGGKIVVNGGVINNQFLAWGGDIKVCGGTFAKDPSKFVADGYHAVKSDDKYVVLPENVEGITTAPVIADSEGTTYEGDLFEEGSTDFLVFQNWVFDGDATVLLKRTYRTVVFENFTADINGDLVVAEVDNTIILQNCDIKLAEGKKLIKTTEGVTVGQVMMHNVTVNGELLTQETAKQYLEGVNWYQVW